SFLMSFINGLLAVFIFKLKLCNNPDMVMIGSIMTMIPGMSFGNSVKDLLIGNTISGILTIINALLISVAIASGLAIPMIIFLKEYITNIQVQVHPIVLLITSLIGSLGFGLLFSLELKKTPIIALGGLLTTLVLIIGGNLISETIRFSTMFTNLIASGFALIVCEILARKLKAPTAIFLLPFLIPLVPGGSLYRTMLYFIYGDYTSATHYLKLAVQTGLGIAIGIVSFGIIVKFIFFVRKLLKNFINKKREYQK
ncbi:MAG: threonine/serine exporter family protein, partial [Clostridia bacterium]|nr:threonine/serine exporter family protein [Clostridia bacterium]